MQVERRYLTVREKIAYVYEELELIHAFVNTKIELQHTDELSAPFETYTWFYTRQLLSQSTIVTREDWLQILALREVLRGLLRANNGFSLSEEHHSMLNQLSARSLLHVDFFNTQQAVLDVDGKDVASLIAYLIGIVYTSMTNKTWYRLKACRNEQCQRAFYDISKNHTHTWCKMQSCGSRMKARAYRQRHCAKS